LDLAQSQIQSMLAPTERTVCHAIRICDIKTREKELMLVAQELFRQETQQDNETPLL
jgi:hypothetical protein